MILCPILISALHTTVSFRFVSFSNLSNSMHTFNLSRRMRWIPSPPSQCCWLDSVLVKQSYHSSLIHAAERKYLRSISKLLHILSISSIFWSPNVVSNNLNQLNFIIHGKWAAMCIQVHASDSKPIPKYVYNNSVHAWQKYLSFSLANCTISINNASNFNINDKHVDFFFCFCSRVSNFTMKITKDEILREIEKKGHFRTTHRNKTKMAINWILLEMLI